MTKSSTPPKLHVYLPATLPSEAYKSALDYLQKLYSCDGCEKKVVDDNVNEEILYFATILDINDCVHTQSRLVEPATRLRRM